jgi:AcrR family transcriptional regulator
VADAVGVTPPSIYLHFADKNALLLAVCEQQFRAFDEYVQSRCADIDDPIAQLQARGEAYIRFGIEHPEPYRLMFMTRAASMPLPEGSLADASGFGHLVENVQRAQAAGAVAEPDTLLVATGLWAMVHGITSLAISVPGFPEVGLDRLVEHVGATYCTGLMP